MAGESAPTPVWTVMASGTEQPAPWTGPWCAALGQLLAWLRPLVHLPRTAWIVPVRYRAAAAGFVLVPVPRRNLPPDYGRGPPAAATRGTKR